MIDAQLYLAFVVGTSILLLTPGPNVALIVANSVAYGTRYGLLTMAGTSSAVVIHLALTVLGMTAVLGVLAHVFEWIRWLGVVYLVYLGVAQWRAAPADVTQRKLEPRSARATYTRGFLVGLTNPKTLLFYVAFFPQFLVANDRAQSQLVALSATFLVLAICLDGAWAVLGGRAHGVLARHVRWRNRLCGGFLIGAGLGLAFARRR